MDRRTKWILSLKPGDTVCTCRHQHRRIVRIEDITELQEGILAVMTYAVALVSLPVAAALHNALEPNVATIVTDRVVYFADGTRCHATRCLDPITDCPH